MRSNDDIKRLPPYNPRYKCREKNVSVPTYGEQSRWDGSLTREKSMLVKLKSFKEQASLCGRINRSLIRERDIFFTVAGSPSVPESVTKPIINSPIVSSKRTFQIDDEVSRNLDADMHTTGNKTLNAFGFTLNHDS
jgi:hypothetical protein